MRLLQITLIISIVLFLASCGKEAMTPDTPDPANDFEIPLVIPTGSENYLNTDSDYIFDQETIHTFDLKIPGSNLAEINADPAAEEYVEGMLIFEGDTISPVGVRYKGSIGGFVDCLTGDNPFDPSGSKICTKLSMKIKINWEGRDEKFFKLKKLQFHSMNLDPSQLHERLGYWLFREMDVPAPRSVHAKVRINDEYVGLFALTEQIDNRFVKYNYDDDDGNLYKEIWPLNFQGAPYSDQEYIDALKTNEDDNPSINIIKNFARSVENASTVTIDNILDDYLDMEEIISYAVVDRTIKHDDGPFHWYCFGDICENHNYYWYEEPSEDKLHLIPWDLDNAFENINNNINPVTPVADNWGQTRNNCEPFAYGAFDLEQRSAACDKLTRAWSSYTDLYNQKKDELNNGPMSEAIINQQLTAWQNQIMEATMEASDAHGDAITVAEWEAAIQKLKDQVEYARNN